MENLDCFVTSPEKTVAETLLQAAEAKKVHLGLLCAAAKIAARFCRSDERDSDPLWIELWECLYCAARAGEKKKPLQLFGTDKGPGHEWSAWATAAALHAHRATMILSTRAGEKQNKIIDATTGIDGWGRADQVLWAAYNVATDNW